MLQRAASSAHSWWWASHVRTKQSKWLEQSLQDMEDKVGSMLKLIEEDGDSFAKRAEMYYKKRPELINFVEESFRAYRSLAERYDHISKELQNANTTIASVFPEQIQFTVEDEEDFASPIVQKTNASQTLAINIPKVPKCPSRDLKGLLTSASKKLQAKKALSSNTIKAAPKSGLSKSEAVQEIDKVQKKILVLQTVKEFVRSSYESGLTKYWEIDSQITEFQERVCGLEDEFRVGKVIEDDEARTLMAEAALKSCEEALAQLQEKQEKSTKAAKTEFKRVNDTHERLKLLKHKFLPEEEVNENNESVKTSGNQECLNPETGGDLTEERLEMEEFIQEIKEHFEVGFKDSLSVTELAEKIDELVSKVISLETAVSSQTALIDRLKTETDDLQMQIKTIEDDKVILTDGTNTLTDRLREVEEKLKGLQDLNNNFEKENNDLQICFTEASCSLDHLSEKLHSVKPDEDTEHMEEEEESSVEGKTRKELEQENMPSPKSGSSNSGGLEEVGDDRSENVITISVTNPGGKEEPKITISEKGDPKTLDKVEKDGMPRTADDAEVGKEKNEEPNWQQMLLNGLEDKEKILLQEYTSILRNYKDIKKKLSDVENKNRDSLFETTVQLRDLRSAISKRDEEIQSLRQKLRLLQEKVGEHRDLEEDNRSIILFDDQNAEPEVTEYSYGNGGVEEDVKLIDQLQSVSPVEEKLRVNIDALLDENLNFWLRFSTSFHQIQKFKTMYQDLEAEILKLKEKEMSNKEGSTRARADIKSNLRPIYAHLSEVQTELTLWIEQSALLKVELQRRFSSLCKIQEEITEALKAGAEEEEMRFTSYEAAKFQGEVLNMKQENKKVRDEIQMGLDHVTSLQLEIEKTLEKLDEEFGISGSKSNNPFTRSTSRSRVPLRSFIFGTKQKKRTSIFSCMHHRKYNDLRSGLPM